MFRENVQNNFGDTRRVPQGHRNLDLQLTALKSAGAARTFPDNGVSGSTVERPQLSKALDRLEAGDVLTVWKLDRLGRNTRHVLNIIEDIRERGAGFRSLTEGLDTTGPMGMAMLTILAAFAQLERDTMIERTGAGLAAAAANNRHGGRPRKIDDAAAARASVPPTSARCSESPAPLSIDIFSRQFG
jgi:DNA invertase Pin-like site-specific DNA recombinase